MQGNTVKFSKETDASGNYTFDTVPVGDYEVEASLTPLTASDRSKVKVTLGVQHKVDLKLK